jgi:PTH1 family peptidyl-tRNA hydrolase
MQLLVGLGNPGPSYAENRHNVGFLAADAIAKRYSFAPLRAKFHGQYGEGVVGEHKIFLLKPQTFMNDSGRSVAEAARFFKIAPAEIAVIHDEIDLKPGKVRAKCGGSSAGHNGLRSIDDYIGPDYWRIRIGVGRPEAGGDAADYVLQNFARADRPWLAATLDAVAEALPHFLDGEAPQFMTKVAMLAPPPSPGAADGDDGV